jgi:hypothetical protein
MPSTLTALGVRAGRARRLSPSVQSSRLMTPESLCADTQRKARAAMQHVHASAIGTSSSAKWRTGFGRDRPDQRRTVQSFSGVPRRSASPACRTDLLSAQLTIVCPPVLSTARR